MDELQSQAKLIKSHINILSVTEVGGALAVIYEFPYRLNGERYWSKQVAFFRNFVKGETYSALAEHVLELRKELEG